LGSTREDENHNVVFVLACGGHLWPPGTRRTSWASWFKDLGSDQLSSADIVDEPLEDDESQQDHWGSMH
jgi:hypothetical protein